MRHAVNSVKCYSHSSDLGNAFMKVPTPQAASSNDSDASFLQMCVLLTRLTKYVGGDLPLPTQTPDAFKDPRPCIEASQQNR